MKSPLTCTVLILLFSVILSFGQEEKDKQATPAGGRQFLEKLAWVKGPASFELGEHAKVEVPEGHMITGPEGTKELLERMGNITGGSELGFFAPTSMTWFVVFEFSDVGFVKDDDKDKIDADKILASIKKGTEEANKIRKSRGVPPLNIIGWKHRPTYNQETHNLEWAIKAESEGDEVINYNTRILGRKGVMEANLVISPDKLAETMSAYRTMLGSFNYKSGEKYAEFRQGDKIAKYGLTALIAGGAAAVAVKTGLFATVLLFFKKVWKFAIIVLIACFGAIKKLFSRSKNNLE